MARDTDLKRTCAVFSGLPSVELNVYPTNAMMILTPRCTAKSLVVTACCCGLLLSGCATDSRMIDPSAARAQREAAMRQEGGGQPATEVVNRDVLLPAMTSINTRIRAYEEKLQDWREVQKNSEILALPLEKRNRINECESQLQDILLEYTSLQKQLQQETRVDAAQLLAGNSLLQLNQQDIDYLESGCGAFLVELKETPQPAVSAAADPQIKAAFDQGDYDQVINLYAKLPLAPNQSPAAETTYQYGLALLKNHQESEARRILGDLLPKVREQQGGSELLLPMMQLVADIDFAGEAYDEARRQYEQVVQLSIEKGAHKEEWPGLQLAALQPGGVTPEEMKEYGALLKNYLAFNPKRDGNAVAEQADRFLQAYPASRFVPNVNTMRNDSRAQAEAWVNQGSKRVEEMAGERKATEVQATGGPVAAVTAPAASSTAVENVQVGNAPPTPVVDEKALQEDYDRGAAHLQAREYDKAIERLNRLRQTAYEAKANPLIAEASKLGAQDARQKAAELFVRATNSRDTEEKRKLLLGSRDLLQGALTKYPQSGLADKIQRNLARIEAELRAVDATTAAPKPVTSGGAYVPPKAGTGAAGAPATSL